jgi:5'-nucleotidase / UDP-sugar diphosphatase
MGGLARRASVIKEVRSSSEHVLLLDAGNAWKYDYGLANSTQGRVIVDGMNRLGYDAMALAAGELNLGFDVFKERLSEAEFPVLSANLTMEATGDPFVAPWITREMAGHRIAIIGLTSPTVQMLLDGGQTGLAVIEPLAAARDAVESLRVEADIIILLSNVGSETDEKLAVEIPEIDVIVGGQNGRILLPPLRPNAEGAVIVQAGALGKQIGLLTLDFDGQGNLVAYEAQMRELADDVPADEETSAWLQTYYAAQ